MAKLAPGAVVGGKSFLVSGNNFQDEIFHLSADNNSRSSPLTCSGANFTTPGLACTTTSSPGGKFFKICRAVSRRIRFTRLRSAIRPAACPTLADFFETTIPTRVAWPFFCRGKQKSRKFDDSCLRPSLYTLEKSAFARRRLFLGSIRRWLAAAAPEAAVASKPRGPCGSSCVFETHAFFSDVSFLAGTCVS